MKTIAEAKNWMLGAELSDLEREIASDAFLSGVEFAQKWISIEEELPPLIETVNAVFDMGNCGNEVVVSVWRGMGTDGKNKYYITLSNVVLLEEPIKWRPINRK